LITKVELTNIKTSDTFSSESFSRSIYAVVVEYAELLGVEFRPHDLRRTYGKLAHKGGAKIEQIQLSYGHASLTTTERYLGIEQDLEDAPCDHLGLTTA
jgi:integrase